MAKGLIWLVLAYFGFSAAWMDERPVLESQNGNLFISSAKDRNITLKILGGGYLNVNDINLLHVATAAHNATRLIERWRTGYLAEMITKLDRLRDIVEGPLGLQRRIIALEGGNDLNVSNSSRIPNRSRDTLSDSTARTGIRRINERIRRLEDKVRTVVTKLKENDCLSNPCQNGASCQDLYEGYQCQCTAGWEGPNCVTDVNECARFLGTDLGCQNGATCFNLPGSYRCTCPPGWFGLHCTKKDSFCNTQNSDELCGHGVCVSKRSSPLGYTCICDQGWESDGSNPACTKDVDECAAKHPPCSVNPPVPCLNSPGSFLCGSCPHGYTGNGYYCIDIDECLVDNGGCSTNPRVQCINTMGSRVCGSCPPGYQGDGVSCVYLGTCRINNGGCHPLATCIENAALPSSYVQCRCPPGYIGDGMGPNGCQIGTDVYVGAHCASNPCLHGTCIPHQHGFTCRCNPGYTGVTCEVQVNPCTPNPCRNNGVCSIQNGDVTCDCSTSFTGSRCETPRQACGGVSRSPVGHLEFPGSGNTYQHGLSCAWVLVTNHTKVLSVNFTSFNLEQSTDCKFDFLQIHDGRNAGSQMIGRFCGNTLPNSNGLIVSSHNALYFWFHSDGSISHDGFAFHWKSIEPVCGDYFDNDYGTIVSPGSPGRYPPNRDCYWYIDVRYGKRIQFHFGQLMLEEHPTCENDYVEITTSNQQRLGLYCNHTHPPPLITPGSSAVIHFHSDSAGQDAGFQIHYSAIEGTPGCGGTYTAISGTISSPGHSTYSSNMECDWKIQLTVGERVKITWHKFDLEDSITCSFDYVEIYDGGDTDAPLLGRFCGSDMPPTIKSESNEVLVIFRTDWSYEMEGFALSYESLCGGEFTEPTGILTSPMYPNTYHAYKTCIYEIIQPVGKGIALTILDMDIEGSSDTSDCYFDHLEIFDGDSENATQLATLCGESSELLTDSFYSKYNYMYLKFTADSSIEGRGFKANYTTIDRRCGGLLRTEMGIIESPTDEEYYSNDEECIWTIQAPPGFVIQLTWLSFSLESHSRCRNDFVAIYENYYTADKEFVGQYCGNRIPPQLVSQGRSITIIFKTDNSVTMEGFKLTYVFVDASKVCGGHYVKLNGVIRSPNYPDSYPNRKECVWVIEAPNKQRVVLDIEYFQLENHSNCIYDYLEIRNGGYDSAPLIGKYCGNSIPSKIMSHTNQLYMKFVSDSSKPADGFSISWDSTTDGCGGTMNSASGEIMTPYYPQPYAHNTECTWKIAVAAGSVIRIIIIDFDLETHKRCRFDYLEISEGYARRNDAQRYCSSSYLRTIEMKSNMATIRFRSDFTNAGRGVHLRYDTLCHNKLHGFYGVIESPNFPNKYEHAMNCSWIIDAPMGNKVNLTFSHFDLEGGTRNTCTFDYLEIKEGSNDVPNTELGRFCETGTLPPKIQSTQNQVFLTFVTDEFIAFNGFRLEWTVHGCGGHLTKPFDSFTSPGYPSNNPRNIDCQWLIEVDYTHSIEITIHEMQSKREKECVGGNLQIYGGQDETVPKLVELCYVAKPLVYTSSGNKMFVKFHSTASFSGHGFNASYTRVALTCGGRFISSSGVIHSTNYPQNYPRNQNCEWLLEVDKSHVVNFTFLDFDLETSRNCSDDYVRIYDGPTRDSPILGSHCGNQLPPTYLSTGNEMLVVMRTDTIITAKGFKAEYSIACGARITVKDVGYLTPSTRYADKSNTLRCTWILSAEDPADHVTLTFTHMDVGTLDSSAQNPSCLSSYVEVFEGESINGTSLEKSCSTYASLPVTSTGNTLTVHLVSESHAFNFVATYSILNSACGGTYSSEMGTVASPLYPDSYPVNSECIWQFNTSPGNRISFTFSDFDIQESENCDLDYLEIREQSAVGKILVNACGKNIDTITSNSQVWMKFKSDSSGTGKGFRAEYHFLGGNELEGPVGQITSPLYPIPYSRAGTFYWRVTVEYEWLVHIDLINKRFHQDERCPSYLRIFDGYDNQAPVLYHTSDLESSNSLDSSSNVVYIEMVCCGDCLFSLSWLQIPRHTEDSGNRDIKLFECTEEISLMDDSNSSYRIASPGWPNGYASSLDCTWVFTSPPGTHLVLRVLGMDLEESVNCDIDFVSVFSGNALTSTKDATLLQKLCYSNSTMTLVKATNIMTIKFETDSYVNKTGFYGYVYRDCGGPLEGPNGVIEFDNSTYYRKMQTWKYNCEWTVTVKPGRTIEVTVTDMAIKKVQDQCSDNYLMLKNGADISSPLLGDGKYCGNVSPAPMQTTGNRLYIKVYGFGPNARFKLLYRQVDMNCGGDYVLTNDDTQWEVSSPNYPNIPPPYSECFWKFMAPAGERLSIYFEERFDLTYSTNCEKEYVEVRDGGTDSSKLIGRFCKDVAPSSMTTTGNMMYLHFYTEMAEPKNGFKAKVSSANLCGRIVRDTTGIITSPNYPHLYPKKQTCGWWIVGPADHTLKIEFLDFHLPSFRRCDLTDHVTISEKVPGNTTLSEIGTYCGLSKPDPIETYTNEAFIVFKSDNTEYSLYKGFSLNFTASRETCGGELTATSGIVKSPGYPNPRTRHRFCAWKVKLPLGFHVVVDILDLDVVNGPSSDRWGYSLMFYNDFHLKSRIKYFSRGDTSNWSGEPIMSSSNTMMIRYWTSIGHRGFKLQYRGVAPAPCGGTLSDVQGIITLPTARPFNESSFYCQWMLQAPENLANSETGLTMTLKITGSVGMDIHFSSRDCAYLQYISVTDIGIICGNFSQPTYLRSPKTVNELTILNGTFGKVMNFNLEYQWQPCGGILRGPTHIIEAPKNIPFPINCAWHADYPDNGETIKLNFARLNLGSCEQGYIIIRNGGPSSPKIGQYCGNLKPDNITSTSRQLWIEYFASGGPNDFQFSLSPIGAGCGSALQGNSRAISSPGFPKQYPNNAECTWEIMSDNGYHIGLIFVTRFNLETSGNCEKDYVQVLDWIPRKEGTWKEIGKVCGRNTPVPFNSTSNRMKVIFRSNEAVQGDGFRAVWEENCGGVFEVTDEPQFIESPGYPKRYRPNLFCNYTLVAKNKQIIVEFVDFHLERGRGNCQFDNITMTVNDMQMRYSENEEETWCGEDKPPARRSTDQLQIIFRTDKYVEWNGFKLKYYLINCGGILTEPGELKPLMTGMQYFSHLNCTWVIKAPEQKNVIVRFEKFVLEYSTSASCMFDSVTIYDGSYIDENKRVAQVCGNLTQHRPVFKSETNSMVVRFISDATGHYEGFTAKVFFVNGPASGCGGIINLTESRTKPFRTQSTQTYESLEECHWKIIAPPGKNIKFTITNIDLKNATNNTGVVPTDRCTGDFLEIRDGLGPFSHLLGMYCGNTIPLPILSSVNKLWIRFVSDGTVEGTGVTGTLEVIDSLCGLHIRMTNDTIQELTSPGYPKPYESGVSCRWVLEYATPYTKINIKFVNFDMADSPRCDDEFLQIVDAQNHKYIDHGFGENFVYSGTDSDESSIAVGTRWPTTTYKYCGSTLPHEFYSSSNRVEILFKAMSGGHRGFKLEYSTATCNRNYTSLQGRIYHEGFFDCWMTITAPANHTISLYFNKLSIYDDKSCTQAGLQVRDGNFNGNLLATLCGASVPNPIFSIGNKLSLRSWSETGIFYQHYDLIYTTTNEGRGCGGEIYNYGGRFTSPLYPNAYRNNTVCEWDVSVPRGLKIALNFEVFDIGAKKHCNNNYIKIYDIVGDVQILRSTFCGGDDPEGFVTESNRVIIKYTSTVNNVGTGWVIMFGAQQSSHFPDVNQ